MLFAEQAVDFSSHRLHKATSSVCDSPHRPFCFIPPAPITRFCCAKSFRSFSFPDPCTLLKAKSNTWTPRTDDLSVRNWLEAKRPWLLSLTNHRERKERTCVREDGMNRFHSNYVYWIHQSQQFPFPINCENIKMCKSGGRIAWRFDVKAEGAVVLNRFLWGRNWFFFLPLWMF